MASRDELKKIIEKLIGEPAYRAKFASDPDSAAKELNITLSPGQLQKAKEFKGSETALQHMAEQAKKDDMYAQWG